MCSFFRSVVCSTCTLRSIQIASDNSTIARRLRQWVIFEGQIIKLFLRYCSVFHIYIGVYSNCAQQFIPCCVFTDQFIYFDQALLLCFLLLIGLNFCGGGCKKMSCKSLSHIRSFMKLGGILSLLCRMPCLGKALCKHCVLYQSRKLLCQMSYALIY